MARAAAGSDFRRRLRDELAIFVVDRIDEHLVDAQVGGKGVFVVGGDHNRVGMWPLLAAWVDRRTLVLDEIRSRAERAIFADWQDGDAAAAVVGG